VEPLAVAGSAAVVRLLELTTRLVGVPGRFCGAGQIVVGSSYLTFRTAISHVVPSRMESTDSHQALYHPLEKRMKLALAAVLLVASTACSQKAGGNDRDTMTQRQKDSVFGQSAVPGASAITKAQTAADSIEAQRKRLDSAAAKPDTNAIR
jgi:hypothetical protein